MSAANLLISILSMNNKANRDCKDSIPNHTSLAIMALSILSYMLSCKSLDEYQVQFYILNPELCD